ncbi:hypothetical protein ACQP2T_41580 [Nonomuraea sp. CA-143628]|uniref:hypothetical protein n=1 Tax=Nonomuraea sp. CA-143628 TaxID=3239997 RepID=UPI003D91E8D6
MSKVDLGPAQRAGAGAADALGATIDLYGWNFGRHRIGWLKRKVGDEQAFVK